MKIAYVILHYKVYSVTKKCIDHILEQVYDDCVIVVIDNCSNNDSYEKLRSEYKENKKVYLISVEFNLGFAKANNLGYQIAKHHFNAELIVAMNNDVMITDTKFSNKLIIMSSEREYDIAGPDIVNKAGEHQNPYVDYIANEHELEMYIRRLEIKKLLIPMLYCFKKRHKVKHVRKPFEFSAEYNNVALHGACIIFGQRFINRYEVPFYPDTFLYGEEDILYFLAKKRKLVTLYYPNLVVYHKEDVSTNSIKRDRKEKRLFEISHTLNSLKVLRKIMKNEEMLWK